MSLAIRYRRAPSVERQQLKWLLLSLAALMSFVFLFDIFLAEWFGFQLPDTLYKAIIAVLWLGLPTTAGLAIFRYGLYDIDRVISRTVAYGLVVATLTIAYVAMVTGVGAVVSEFSPSNIDLPMPVVATALVAIASIRCGREPSGWPTGWCSEDAGHHMRLSPESGAHDWKSCSRRSHNSPLSRRQHVPPLSGSQTASSCSLPPSSPKRLSTRTDCAR